MQYLVVNVGTGRAYGKHSYCNQVYPTQRGAKGMCTRLNREYSGYEMTCNMPAQWTVMSETEYNNKPVKMVERTNIMTGKKFMEAENTPYFCSPSSESYFSM